jgi:hypothetical protein
MMTHDDNDAGENLLAGIDLHTWRVPPPAEVHRPSLLVRALSPATPTKRPRVRWLVAALVLFNAAIAALLVILLSRPAPSQTVVYQAAGGGSVDAQVRDLLARLESEQRELERRLAEIKELRALVTDLSEKVRLYEQQDANRRERTVPRPPRDNKTPAPTPAPNPIDPYDSATPPHQFNPSSTTNTGGCDEVSCVLGNYSGACCAKYRIQQPPQPQVKGPPENLSRQMISTGIANVKASVAACGDVYKIKGKVKARVHVDASGRVTNVEIEVTPDPMLGACVASVLSRATFDKTRAGGSFSYPFIF